MSGITALFIEKHSNKTVQKNTISHVPRVGECVIISDTYYLVTQVAWNCDISFPYIMIQIDKEK